MIFPAGGAVNTFQRPWFHLRQYYIANSTTSELNRKWLGTGVDRRNQHAYAWLVWGGWLHCLHETVSLFLMDAFERITFVKSFTIVGHRLSKCVAFWGIFFWDLRLHVDCMNVTKIMWSKVMTAAVNPKVLWRNSKDDLTEWRWALINTLTYGHTPDLNDAIHFPLLNNKTRMK